MTRIIRFVRVRRRAAAAVALGAGLVAAIAWVRLGPIPDGLLDPAGADSTVVVDRKGVPLYESRAADGTRTSRIDAAAMPAVLADATIAAEDRRFHSHPGVDPVAIARALKVDLVERRIVEGGSTITMQAAKLLLNRRSPSRARGLGGKLAEAVLAMRLEHRLSKAEILALYLNLAAYGNQIVGAGRASQIYFGHDAATLTPAEAAFLAGLPQRPSGFNPYRHPDAAMARQRAVLQRMVRAGSLTAERAREARDERLAFARKGAPFAAPHFVEMVLKDAGQARPARIETTLDSALQADVAGIIRSHRELLSRHGAGNVAVVVLDNRSGEWLAWEGSGDYFDAAHGGTINGPAMPRQPGSALKPFTYALAFEQGYGPASVLPDIPSHFPTTEPGVLYSPRNYDGRYRGPLLARRALAGSENVPAVALASDLGVPALQRFLVRAGFSTFTKSASYYGLGLTLGNAEVRLDELVAAYAALARGGEWMAPTWRVEAPPRERRRLVSERTAFWVTDILSDAGAREYIFGRGGHLEFPFPVAAKTGTSQAYHDNWTVGYTATVTVGVWVGNFDRTPLRDSTGVTGAGPIFHAVMLAAERRLGPGSSASAVPPSTVESREICALSGMAASPACPNRQREWLAPGGEALPCSWHHIDDGRLLVVWPTQYRQWASGRLGASPGGLGSDLNFRKTAKIENRDLAPPAGPRRAPAAGLTIISPPTGATYLIDPTLRREFQTLTFRASAPVGSRIVWSVNDREVGSGAQDEALAWPLAPGEHRVTARDDSGRRAEARIVVR